MTLAINILRVEVGVEATVIGSTFGVVDWATLLLVVDGADAAMGGFAPEAAGALATGVLAGAAAPAAEPPPPPPQALSAKATLPAIKARRAFIAGLLL
ncbi:hypothetical protein [Paraburkholderia eburnea]|uniref:hypothetical protein n=1 Tax=Paraburkholderia eburnea TaxID=1189126 RepID=UPI0038994916